MYLRLVFVFLKHALLLLYHYLGRYIVHFYSYTECIKFIEKMIPNLEKKNLLHY